MGYRGSLGIVERLRESPLPSLNRIGQDRADAADEIERLRAALKGIEVYATSKEDAKGMAAKALLASEQTSRET